MGRVDSPYSGLFIGKIETPQKEITGLQRIEVKKAG